MANEKESTVSIDYARERRRELERNIDQLVHDFTRDTGLVITSIGIPRIVAETFPGGKVNFYGETQVEVRLP